VRDVWCSNEKMIVTVFWYKKGFRLTLPFYTFTFPSKGQNSKLNMGLFVGIANVWEHGAFPSWLLLDQ
jgi:hypothetical protein